MYIDSTPAGGDPRGWMHCLPKLNRYAHSLARNRPEEAEDLVQATVERALKLDWSSGEIQSAEAYLIRILRNIHRDQLRRKSADPTVEAQEIPEPGAPATQDLTLICSEAIEAIEKLPRDHREMLKLAAFDGLSYREIAKRLNLPIGTVTSRLARARAALAASLGWDRGAAPYPA